MTKTKREALRILHVADVHLGAGFPWLGERGAAQRRRLRQTFADALAKGSAEGAGLVLIAGDLFGSSRPHPELTDFVRSQFARLAADGIETVIAAGENDGLDAQGAYAGGALDGLAGVTILPATPKVVEFPGLDLAVSGRSAVKGKEISDPFKGLAPGRLTRTVGLVAVDPRRAGGRDALARSAAAAKFTYLALGGSHRTLDLGGEEVAAWYPGSLELLARGEPPGAALLVDLGGDGARVTPLPVARGRVQRLVLEPAAYPTLEAVTAEIEALADPDLLLEVRVSGRAHPAQFIDVMALEQSLASRFFALEILDEAMPDPSAPGAGPVGTITVPGKFSELMTHQLQQAGSEAERRRIGAAYRLGLWLLTGRGGRA
ncbi:MAG: metallophosphoesterase [Armatimonadetes bacterium]|nr:metallophosphoesterase [Armatimonadota bacterium]